MREKDTRRRWLCRVAWQESCREFALSSSSRGQDGRFSTSSNTPVACRRIHRASASLLMIESPGCCTQCTLLFLFHCVLAHRASLEEELVIPRLYDDACYRTQDINDGFGGNDYTFAHCIDAALSNS